jgi:hypothetical protein
VGKRTILLIKPANKPKPMTIMKYKWGHKDKRKIRKRKLIQLKTMITVGGRNKGIKN